MKSIWKLLKKFFSGTFQTIASIASIIGLTLAFLSDKNAVLIALVTFILFLGTILVRFFQVIETFILSKTEKGYHKFATYVRYSTTDGKHIVFEIHKYIQCKRLIITEHIHEFKWTGSVDPKISSDQQEFIRAEKKPPGEYDLALFKFKNPLTYNQFNIVQIKMDLDDTDEKSKKHVGQGIKEPLQLLNYRIELGHLQSHKDAKIMRRKKDTRMPQDYETIGFVPFDTISRGYEYNVFNPEVGYDYKIDWS